MLLKSAIVIPSVTFVPQNNKEHRKDNKKLEEEFKTLEEQLVKTNLSDF